MKKILVVDDEPSLQEMLKDILSLADFNVVTANDGEEGLKMVYEASPDLIILDCSMPKLDGYEMLERMRQDPVLLHQRNDDHLAKNGEIHLVQHVPS